MAWQHSGEFLVFLMRFSWSSLYYIGRKCPWFVVSYFIYKDINVYPFLTYSLLVLPQLFFPNPLPLSRFPPPHLKESKEKIMSLTSLGVHIYSCESALTEERNGETATFVKDEKKKSSTFVIDCLREEKNCKHHLLGEIPLKQIKVASDRAIVLEVYFNIHHFDSWTSLRRLRLWYVPHQLHLVNNEGETHLPFPLEMKRYHGYGTGWEIRVG